MKVCQTILKSINLLHKECLVQTAVATTVARSDVAAGRRQWAAAGAPHMVEMAAKRTVGGQEAIAGWHPTVADNAYGDGRRRRGRR